MSLVEGIMCHSIHYFTIVFNISLLQYVQLVSNVSLSCILYMLLPFDVGIIYLLYVNKCTHLVSGGIRTFGDNFAHARVKGHDFENGEYLNSK